MAPPIMFTEVVRPSGVDDVSILDRIQGHTSSPPIVDLGMAWHGMA